jgi:hypothetical protein
MYARKPSESVGPKLPSAHLEHQFHRFFEIGAQTKQKSEVDFLAMKQKDIVYLISISDNCLDTVNAQTL